jgi:hypothetical protein
MPDERPKLIVTHSTVHRLVAGVEPAHDFYRKERLGWVRILNAA